MAAINLDFESRVNDALKGVTTMTQAQDKFTASLRKTNDEVQKGQRLNRSGGSGRYPNRSSGRGDRGGGGDPGGGIGQGQLKNIIGALGGIAGLGAVMKQLNDAVNENTQALLNTAKKQQEIAKTNVLSDSQLKSNRIINEGIAKRNQNLKEGELPYDFYKLRGDLAMDTATPTEEINKILQSFAGEVSTFEELESITKEIAAAAKLGLTDISTLVDAERANLKNRNAAVGDATKGISILADKLKNVYSDIIDEVQASGNFRTGTGAAMYYADTKGEYSVEDSLQKLNALLEEGSLQQLRDYSGGRLEGVSGLKFLEELVKFTDERSGALGLTGDQTIDRYVDQKGMSREEANIFKDIYRNFDEFKNYINSYNLEVNINSEDFQKKLSEFTDPSSPEFNKSFAQSLEADLRKVREEVINSLPTETEATKKQTEQDEFTKRMQQRGFGRMTDDEGQIPMAVWNQILSMATTSLSDFESINKIYKDTVERNEKIPEQIGNVLSAIFGETSGKFLQGGLEKTISVGNALNITGITPEGIMTATGEGLPFLGSYLDYKKTGKLGPETITYENKEGELETETTFGPLINVLIDLVSGFAGGMAGGKFAKSSGKNILDNIGNQKNKLEGMIAEGVEKTARKQSLHDEIAPFVDPDGPRLERQLEVMEDFDKVGKRIKQRYRDEGSPGRYDLQGYKDELKTLRQDRADAIKNIEDPNLTYPRTDALTPQNIDTEALHKEFEKIGAEIAESEKLQKSQKDLIKALEKSESAWTTGWKNFSAIWAGRVGGGGAGSAGGRVASDFLFGDDSDVPRPEDRGRQYVREYEESRGIKSRLTPDEQIEAIRGESNYRTEPAPKNRTEAEEFKNYFSPQAEKMKLDLQEKNNQLNMEILEELKKSNTRSQIEYNKNKNKPYNRNTFR